MTPIRKKAEDVFDIYAIEYNKWIKGNHTFNETYDVLCDLIPRSDASILDLACGPGNITHYLLNKNPELDVTCTDLAPTMVRIAKENNPTAKVIIQDCRNFLELEQKFDAIICGFGLPYIDKIDTIQLIGDASKSLSQNGMFYISVIENASRESKFETSSSGEYETQMYYHKSNYLKEAFLNSGFEVVYEKRFESMNKKGEPAIDLVLIGKKSK